MVKVSFGQLLAEETIAMVKVLHSIERRVYNVAQAQSTECRLSTIDNPYNPFTQYDSWFLYDVEKGYNSSAYLARVIDSNPTLYNEDVDDEDIEKAIDDIIKADFTNMYIKVKKE